MYINNTNVIQAAYRARNIVISQDNIGYGLKKYISLKLDKAIVEYYIKIYLLVLQKTDLLSNKRSA